MADNPTLSESPTLDAEIERILSSRTLRRSDQLRKLLAYLGQMATSADPANLSEHAIGTRVFGRKDFNPKLDTIVRSEMLRLRRKMDEYYSEEATDTPYRLGFARNSYCPLIITREQAASASPTSTPETRTSSALVVNPESGEPPKRGFWVGFWAGAVLMLLAAAVLAFALTRSKGEAKPSPLASEPLWAGFAGSSVDVLLGTPLFFLNEKGFQRVFTMNMPEDLPLADRELSLRPAYPYWDLWAPYENIPGAVALSRGLDEIGSKATFLGARDRSVSTLQGRKTIIIGHPRFAPLLVDLLADADFRPPQHAKGKSFGGFRNAAPKPDEREVFDVLESTLAQRSDESMPDHALVTSLRLPNGGEVLSIFGNRVQSGGFLMHALLDRNLLAQLNAKTFSNPPAPYARYRSAQIVLRIDYSKGKPTGAVYVTHRIHY